MILKEYEYVNLNVIGNTRYLYLLAEELGYSKYEDTSIYIEQTEHNKNIILKNKIKLSSDNFIRFLYSMDFITKFDMLSEKEQIILSMNHKVIQFYKDNSFQVYKDYGQLRIKNGYYITDDVVKIYLIQDTSNLSFVRDICEYFNLAEVEVVSYKGNRYNIFTHIDKKENITWKLKLSNQQYNEKMKDSALQVSEFLTVEKRKDINVQNIFEKYGWKPVYIKYSEAYKIVRIGTIENIIFAYNYGYISAS